MTLHVDVSENWIRTPADDPGLALWYHNSVLVLTVSLCPAAFASVVFTHVVKELSCLISVLFLSYHRLICLQNSFL